jgi:hypothetical protein
MEIAPLQLSRRQQAEWLKVPHGDRARIYVSQKLPNLSDRAAEVCHLPSQRAALACAVCDAVAECN